MQELKPVAWRTMDTPPREEDGTVLVWAENMPVSMGCCEDGYYVFTECEDLHNYFEGNASWLKDHWTLWMHLPNPSGKNQLFDTHRIVPVELLERVNQFTAVAAEHYSGMNDEVCQSYSEPWQQGVALGKELRAIIDKE